MVIKLVQNVSLCVSVVCHGTQNGLSSTGSQENQYNLIKDRYDGCEIIIGNLEITQIESNWDFSFLKVENQQTAPLPCRVRLFAAAGVSNLLCFHTVSRPSVR